MLYSTFTVEEVRDKFALKINYMQGDIVLLDPVEYSLSPIEKLLALLNWMVRIETDYL
jgi:hypothetical protein